MKNRVTFLIISSKTGAQKSFSVNKGLLYAIVLFAIFLLGSGIIGVLKYMENISLKKESMLLEAKKQQLETVARTVQDIKHEEKAIKQLLGLEDADTGEDEP